MASKQSVTYVYFTDSDICNTQACACACVRLNILIFTSSPQTHTPFVETKRCQSPKLHCPGESKGRVGTRCEEGESERVGVGGGGEREKE